jgi:ComF family protein
MRSGSTCRTNRPPASFRWLPPSGGRSGGAGVGPAVMSGVAESLWLRAADALLAVLLAPACAACERPLDEPTSGPVCRACWAAVVPITPPVCETCGDPLPSWRTISLDLSRCPRCRRRPGPVVNARAIGAYTGTLRDIIHAFKYDGRRRLGRPLGALVASVGTELLAGADMTVPVPLHPSRLRARGFNQASEIARYLGLPVVHALRRSRATPSQTDLPAARRHANVRGAFRLAPRCRVTGALVVLVDDVSTTGATLDACARVLLEAGAREVRALTAARVVTRRP